MSDDRVGEVVDLSQVQTQDEAHNVIFDRDFGNQALTAAGSIPVAGFFVNLAVQMDENGDAFQELFNGEPTRENITAVALSTIDIVESFAGLVGEGVAMMEGDFTFLIGSLSKAGLDWLVSSVQPVEDVYGYFAGNPERMKTAAEMWKGVSEELHALAEGYQSAAADTIQPAWQSYSGTGAMTRTNEYLDAIQTTRDLAWTLSLLVDSMSDLSKRLIDFINQVIVDIAPLILKAIQDGFKYLWGAVITVGIDLAITLTQYSLKCLAIAMRATHAFITAGDLAQQLEDTFADMMGLLNLLTHGATQTAS